MWSKVVEWRLVERILEHSGRDKKEHREKNVIPTVGNGVGTCPTAHSGKTRFHDACKYIGKTYFPTVGVLEFPPWYFQIYFPRWKFRYSHSGKVRFPNVFTYIRKSSFPLWAVGHVPTPFPTVRITFFFLWYLTTFLQNFRLGTFIEDSESFDP